MSQMIWHKMVVPGRDAAPGVFSDSAYGASVEHVRALPWQNAEIPIPNAKAFRSMSRASLLLSHVCMQANEVLSQYSDKSIYSVGVYAAVENGPIDAASTATIIQNQDAMGFSAAYRKFRNAKMYLKQLPNLAPAQMGISMGLRGPMNVYTHSSAGALQALEQAEWDLANGVVEAALVCTAHAFDDYLLVKRTRQRDARCLAEGAAAMVLVPSGQSQDGFTHWSEQVADDDESCFGISSPIINLLKRGKYV